MKAITSKRVAGKRVTKVTKDVVVYQIDEQLKLALAGANIGFWNWDFSSGKVSYSKEWSGMLGYEAGELDSTANAWEALIHPDDLPIALEALQRHIDGKTPMYETEIRCRTKNGEWRWILDRGRVIEWASDGTPVRAAGTHLDINDSKIAEEKLQQSEARYKRITKGLTDYQYTVRLENGFPVETIQSSACERVTGYTREEFAADSYLWIQMVAPEDQELVREHIRQLMAGIDMPALEHRIIRKDGELRWVKDTTILFRDASGKLLSYDGVIKDITERKMAQEEMERYRAELEQRVEYEVRTSREKDRWLLQQDKMASIGQLAAGVVHEINNPVGFITSNLATLKGYSETVGRYCSFLKELIEKNCNADIQSLLQNEIDTQDIEFILEDIGPLITQSAEGTNRVKQIVMDLKEFARVDDKELHPVDLNKCINSTLNMVRNEVKYKADVNLQLGDIPQVVCSANQINQVIANLLVNAGHAIEKYGTITVTSRQDGNDVIITVSDNGCGMAEDIRSRIFEPFYTTKEAGKGTGLGLSISQDIIKKHNGEITVESEQGKGTTFTVRLPINGVQEASV